jgi:hypothetical protein
MKLVKLFVIVSGGLIVLALLALFAMGRRPDAGRITGTVELDGPPSSVLPWLVEPARLKRWVSWLADVRGDSTAEAAVGRTQVWVMDDGKSGATEMVTTITAWAPPDSFRRSLSVPGLVEGENAYTLADVGGRTRLTVEGRYHHPNPMIALLEPLATPEAAAKLRADLSKLRVLVASLRIEEAPPGDSLGLAPMR